VWRTSGAVSVWDLSTISRDPSPAIALTGQFGELMRSNYPRTGGIASLTDLELFVRSDGFRFDAAKLLRPAARRHFDDVVVRLLRAAHPPGGTPQDAVDGYYQLARIRTWFGSSNELDNRNRLYPLYSMPAARAAFAMGSSRRRMEAMPFEVIRANCPELLTMPFASSAWPESLIAGLPDAHRYPTTPDAAPWTAPTRRQRRASRKPFVSGGATAGVSVEQRRMEDIDAKIPVLREFLDLGPGHELYSYLDYDSTMSAVDNLGGMFFSGRRAVHDAVTAAMWLDGAEMPEAL
jgi:hypothetical protein